MKLGNTVDKNLAKFRNVFVHCAEHFSNRERPWANIVGISSLVHINFIYIKGFNRVLKGFVMTEV